MMKPLLLVLLLLPIGVHAQGVLLWKATNITSATVIPPYAGQPNPFPKFVAPDEAPAPLTAEAEAARQARISALEKAEKFLAGKAAFKPELGLIRIDGRLEGAAGPKVLISNQWVGKGRMLQVRLLRTAEATAAIQELRKYDEDAASQLEAKLDLRLQQTPYLSLEIAEIKDKEVQLHSDYGTHIISISNAQGN